MTNPALAAPVYYQHSGRFSPSLLAFALLAAIGLTLLSATLFAYTELYLPIGGYVTFLLIFGFGYVVGRGTGALLQRAKVRNNKVAAGTGLVIGLLAVYWAWLIWVFAFLQRNVQPGQPLGDLTLWKLLLHPIGLWYIIGVINDFGPWTLGHDLHPTGFFLGLLWLIEAGGIIYLAVKWPLRKIREVPFCENCQKWGRTRQILRTNVALDSTLRQNMEQKNFDFIPPLGLADKSNQWHHYSLQGCADCDTTQTLTVDRFTLTRDKNNRPKTSYKTIVRQLRLTPEETVHICTIAAQMTAAPEPPITLPPPA